MEVDFSLGYPSIKRQVLPKRPLKGSNRNALGASIAHETCSGAPTRPTSNKSGLRCPPTSDPKLPPSVKRPSLRQVTPRNIAMISEKLNFVLSKPPAGKRKKASSNPITVPPGIPEVVSASEEKPNSKTQRAPVAPPASKTVGPSKSRRYTIAAPARTSTQPETAAQLQTNVASARRNSEFHGIFPIVSPADRLIDDYACSLYYGVGQVQGRLYLSQRYICFQPSKSAINKHELSVPLQSVIALNQCVNSPVTSPIRTSFFSPRNSISAGPPSEEIQISTATAKHSFTGFLDFQSTFDDIHKTWKPLAEPRPTADELFKGAAARKLKELQRASPFAGYDLIEARDDIPAPLTPVSPTAPKSPRSPKRRSLIMMMSGARGMAVPPTPQSPPPSSKRMSLSMMLAAARIQCEDEHGGFEEREGEYAGSRKSSAPDALAYASGVQPETTSKRRSFHKA